MKRMTKLQSGLAVLLVCLMAVGCAKSDKTSSEKTGKSAAGGGHPTEGPHGGALVELGEEEYHGEFVFDEKTETVTIYILDSGATKTVPIEAKDVTINLKHDGEGKQYKLAASADKGDPEGKSSRFSSNDEDLAHDLGHDDAEPKLKVTIKGKQFEGNIPHGDTDGKPHVHTDDKKTKTE